MVYGGGIRGTAPDIPVRNPQIASLVKRVANVVNSDKCHILHLGARDQKFKYIMGGRVLERVDSEKDLGVIVHKSLKPSAQCAKAAGKANQVLGQRSRAVRYKNTFLKLYSVYVRPHLEYDV